MAYNKVGLLLGLQANSFVLIYLTDFSLEVSCNIKGSLSIIAIKVGSIM
jgi:hypothetical protein